MIIVLFLCSSAYAKHIENADIKEPRLVADQLYAWDCPEGNLGIFMVGKFNSREQMEETFSLSREIGEYKGRTWKLSDILVSTGFNANGDVANWEVSGPKPLLLSYVRKLEEQHEDDSLLYDFGYWYVNFKPSAYWEEMPISEESDITEDDLGYCLVGYFEDIDLNNDGELEEVKVITPCEIFTNSACGDDTGTTIKIIDSQGYMVFWDEVFRFQPVEHIVLEDVDGDGTLEIAVSAGRHDVYEPMTHVYGWRGGKYERINEQ
ncbi:hypothetical protein ACFL38_05100 [Candidatus Omnitrophota bacterium]